VKKHRSRDNRVAFRSLPRGIVGRALGGEHGIALVITLFVVALVTVLVLEYHFDAKIELDLAANYAREVQANQLAMAGMQFARALLQQDGREADGPDDTWFMTKDMPCIPPRQLLTLAEADSAAAAPVFAENQEEGQTGRESQPAEQGCVILRITDEQSKLPVNALMPTQEGEEVNPTWRPIFEEFFLGFQIEPEVIGALVDWIDANDVPSGLGGAETPFYEALETPYRAPNRAMRTPGELRLVRGVDTEMLNKLFPDRLPEEMPDIDVGSNAYVTTFGNGAEARVNMNTANEPVLQALLSGLQGGSAGVEDEVLEIIARRQEAQFASSSEVSALIPDSGAQSQLAEVAEVKSLYFRVESIGSVDVVQKRAVAVFRRGSQNDLTPVYFKME
jgi:general secretion pathway protein K